MELKIYLVSALVSAAIWSLPAAAISLIYGVLRYPNFAIPELMTLGAYLTLLLCGFGVPLWVAGIFSALLTGLVALALDQTVFRFVRRAGMLPPVLLSLGVMLVVQNFVRFVWGNGNLQFPITPMRPVILAGFIISPIQLIIIATGIAILGAIFLSLRFTEFGRAIRATSTNPELAVVTGVQPERVYAAVLFVAGFLSAVGGTVLATETSLNPLLGWRVLIPLFAVAILGGLGSVVGAALAALLVGLASEFSLLILPSSYKTALAFLVLTLVLLVRPSGLIKSGS
ncbi:branched-chain amino acid ABC transporter permease [Mesorhizobium hawassense]|uniref:Branched-chain amino acid ABC transporter permease n=1 Tax=Mesorhizobium hawassense TaxID=1209954 RepID=A0A330H8R9_9HYPH|nr:branched-chain amino acid ABC transporter permease [Mesorhizobium hawassense]RAZ84775.1 branched-chain amino acid ABC transporter permease [Mesorhizobium hawassense]